MSGHAPSAPSSIISAARAPLWSGCRIWRGAASIGEDTTDVLTKLLRLPEDEIADLYRQNIVHRTEPFETPQVDAVHP